MTSLCYVDKYTVVRTDILKRVVGDYSDIVPYISSGRCVEHRLHSEKNVKLHVDINRIFGEGTRHYTTTCGTSYAFILIQWRVFKTIFGNFNGGKK
jgi:hypothetical protein